MLSRLLSNAQVSEEMRGSGALIARVNVNYCVLRSASQSAHGGSLQHLTISLCCRDACLLEEVLGARALMGVTWPMLASRCALRPTPATRSYAVFSLTRHSEEHAGALLRHLNTEGVCARYGILF